MHYYWLGFGGKYQQASVGKPGKAGDAAIIALVSEADVTDRRPARSRLGLNAGLNFPDRSQRYFRVRN
ncbi:MAG: hypothetical protein U0Q18_12340 [Bryobacteraceae bacterium]